MSPLPTWLATPRMRAWAWWLLPALVLGALIGWETDWGRHVLRVPEDPPVMNPRPAESSVLPEYALEGGLAAHSETVNRTLFNPTRRPAPALPGEEGGPRQIQHGQFQLMGTAMSGGRNIAFLKETAAGKGRVVRQGDEINGMKVAFVGRDRVLFVAGNDKEELVLKTAASPIKTTPAAPVPGMPRVVPGVPLAPTAVPAAPAPARAAGHAVTPTQAARRAARAAAAAAAAASHELTPAAPGVAQPPPVSPSTPGPSSSNGMPAQSDASWAAVYQRMQLGK